MRENKKIVVIGGGIGGYNIALEFAKKGWDTILIEKKDIGGTCLNEGCIPTKMLLHYAKKYRDSQNMKNRLDVFVNEVDFNWREIQDTMIGFIHSKRDGIRDDLLGRGIRIIQGEATFLSENQLLIHFSEDKEETLDFDFCIIATGANPNMLLKNEFASSQYCTSSEIIFCDRIPSSMLIVGGGIIGIEIAEIYSAFGCHVTILEQQEDILQNMDKDVVSMYKRSLKDKNIQIYTEAKIIEIEDTEEGKNCVFSQKNQYEEIFVDKVLVAVGRKPNIETLNLEKAEISSDTNGIHVDRNYMTSNERVFAIGDCINEKKLAHLAMQQVRMVFNYIVNKKEAKEIHVPLCCYAHPQMVSVTSGEMGDHVYSKKRLFKYNSIANMNEEQYGLIKFVVNKDDLQIKEIHMAGDSVTEFCGEAALIVNQKMKLDELANIVHAHPTLNEEFQVLAKEILDELGM